MRSGAATDYTIPRPGVFSLFRTIATRYEKTAGNFLAAVQLVASVVWLN